MILPSAPLVVNVARSGGMLGRTVSWRSAAEPSSATHAAALALLRLGPPDPAPTRSRDGYTYAVTITVDARDEPLLDARYHDPVPFELADLVSALTEDDRRVRGGDAGG